MRFCMLSTFYPPHHFGGDATYVRALSRELVRRGHHVEVVYCEDAFNVVNHQGPAVETVIDDGVVVHRLKSRFGVLSPLITQQTGNPGLKRSALKEILDQNFDVVNFHNISLLGGPGILKLSRAPVTLFTLHEHWLLCPTHVFWKNKQRACEQPQCFRCSIRSAIPPQFWRYTGLIHRSLQAVDRLLAPSEFTADKHLQGGVKQEVRVLPLFSLLDPGGSETRTPVEPRKFVYVGRVTASKGVVPLLRLFARLQSFRLQLIGDGDLLERLKAEYAQCGNIEFTAAVEQTELVRHYQNACALILPSLAPETFGLTVVEAFACGTPVLVRKAGGSSELVKTTGAGFVYRDDDELEKYLYRIAEDHELRSGLGKKAREGFTRHYSIARHMEAYFGHIAEIQRRKGVDKGLMAETP
jgi:glycosyltransferase involved in cell wall biosynthesis